jgi:hypothetical protein
MTTWTKRLLNNNLPCMNLYNLVRVSLYGKPLLELAAESFRLGSEFGKHEVEREGRI